MYNNLANFLANFLALISAALNQFLRNNIFYLQILVFLVFGLPAVVILYRCLSRPLVWAIKFILFLQYFLAMALLKKLFEVNFPPQPLCSGLLTTLV